MSSILTNKVRTFIAYLLAILTLIALIIFIALRQTSELDFTMYKPYEPIIIDGMKNTIIVSVLALIGSMILGFIFFLMQKSKIKYFNALIDVLTEIVYGTPLMVLIILMGFLIGPAFGLRDITYVGVYALVIYMAPYMKNVFKSAFSSISDEQYLAMDLFGFTSFQRYLYIIFPQAIRILMPPMMNNFSLIIKGSALLHFLSYFELFQAISSAQSRTFAFVEGYLLMWVLYLIITIPLSQMTKWIERKWSL
ncbi:MAG: amino acid ABC transporter permease [Candidatus Izemoplasmatales bacterium]|uniref:Amino acid ABC transporter permease n=1 Tax=Hujiaoplasma nucleasis TaxID=2725268 RepID=A0A7L6N131_9MOLU|nr:amino acid ABC transporter permease [Hujiaoplasma nucleasis]QLY39960.1 amino acid ABC transporter permease [Hujiaoplasma nucleasis]